jgi:hypothetical protein
VKRWAADLPAARCSGDQLGVGVFETHGCRLTLNRDGLCGADVSPRRLSTAYRDSASGHKKNPRQVTAWGSTYRPERFSLPAQPP